MTGRCVSAEVSLEVARQHKIQSKLVFNHTMNHYNYIGILCAKAQIYWNTDEMYIKYWNDQIKYWFSISSPDSLRQIIDETV